MLYRIAADAVLVVHFAFVLFALLGGLLVLRSPGLAWLHLPTIAWAAFVTRFRNTWFSCDGEHSTSGTSP